MNWRVERAVKYTVPTIAASALLTLAGCEKSAEVQVEAPEYSKVVKGTELARIAGREVPNAPHEVLLVLDATTGQNGLIQAREFTKTARLTGLILAKLDGTAKGGVVTAIVKELQIPIRFIGTGEKIDDLVEFSADDFIDSLFAA